MAYRQFTKCCSPGDYVPFPGTQSISLLALLVLTTFAAVAVALASAASAPVIVLVGLALAADVAVIAACIVYLYHRLICLDPRQQCAIGMVFDVTPPSSQGKIWIGDNDYTIDIFLPPGPTDFSDLSKSQDHVQGGLNTEQNLILAAGLGYEGPAKERFCLHCEFEGRGVLDLLEFASEILVFLIVILALILLEAVVPALAPLLTLLEILAGLLAGLGLLAPHLPGSEGTPTEEGSPNLGQLSPGDIVVVSGDWVYDGGHGPGWNEIHAVHSCLILLDHTRVPKDAKGNWSWPTGTDQELGLDLHTDAKILQVHDVCCTAIGNATVAETGGSRTDPANNWIVHPLVDGCKKSPVIV